MLLPRRNARPAALGAGFLTVAPLRAADADAWAEGFAAMPGVWGFLALAAIFSAAFAVHLKLRTREGRAAREVEEARRALEHANYQEAWTACRRGAAATFARLLGPALERIGQGRDHVEAAIVAGAARERRQFRRLLAAWAVVGLGVPLLALAVAGARHAGQTRPETSAQSARELTRADGEFALLAAVALAIAATAAAGLATARRRAHALVAEAETETRTRLQDLAYEDLAGLRIGRDFDAGTLLEEEEADEARAATGRLRVSRTLTTACPRCNAAINASHRACPHCGLVLEWA